MLLLVSHADHFLTERGLFHFVEPLVDLFSREASLSHRFILFLSVPVAPKLREELVEVLELLNCLGLAADGVMARQRGGAGLLVCRSFFLQFLHPAAFSRNFNLWLGCNRFEEIVNSNSCDAVLAHFVLVIELVAVLVDLIEQRVGLHAVGVVAVALRVSVDDEVVSVVDSQSILT